MPRNQDWFPGRRADALAMAGNWMTLLGQHAAAWGVPQADVTELGALKAAAQTALDTVESAARTEGAVQTCRDAFDALAAHMRLLKKRYLMAPVLSSTDLVNLGLDVPDDVRTDVPEPRDQAGLEVVKWAPGMLGLRLFTQAELGGDPEANYGFRVYYAPVAAAGDGGEAGSGGTGDSVPAARRLAGDVFFLDAPPRHPADLPNSFFTRKRLDDLTLPPEASGKPCWLSARYENSKGARGPWGELTVANVP